MEIQKTSNSQSNLEKEEWNWRNQPAWLQALLQSHSHQERMVLAQRQKYRSMEQNTKPRDKSTNLWKGCFLLWILFQAQANAPPWGHLHLRQNLLPVFQWHLHSCSFKTKLIFSFGSTVSVESLSSVSREWLCAPTCLKPQIPWRKWDSCVPDLSGLSAFHVLVWENCSFQKHFY